MFKYSIFKKNLIRESKEIKRKVKSYPNNNNTNSNNHDDSISLNSLIYQNQNKHYNNDIPIETTQSYEKSNLKNLIAGQIDIHSTRKNDVDGHALGIIRFKNDFYLIDDNIGKAIPIKNIQEFTGNNFIMKILRGYIEYYFGNDLIYKKDVDANYTNDETFTQQHNIDELFIYKIEGA
jgi:hypothetical protein